MGLVNDRPFGAKALLFFVGIVALVCLLASAATSEALEINIGTLLPLARAPVSQLAPTNQRETHSQYQFFAGMRAAFEEANEKQTLGPGVTVNLLARALDVNFGVGLPEAADLAVNHSVVALLGVSYYSSVVTFPYFAKPNNIPFIGGLAADVSSLYGDRTAVNYRFSFDVETTAWINYAVNSRMACVKAAVYYYGVDPGVTKLAQSAKATLESLGMRSVLMAETDPNFFVTFNVTPFLSLLDDPATRPQCIFMLVSAEFIPAHLAQFTADPRFDRDNMFFFAPSVSNLPSYEAPYLANLFISQQLPYPAEAGTSQLVAAFHNALAASVARNATPPPGIYNTIDPQPDYFNLEGYTIGRLALEMLKAARGNYTPEALLDSLYRTRYVTIEDIVLGPYIDKCVPQLGDLGLPCFCNVGNKFSYVTRANPATGRLEKVVDDTTWGEINVAKSVTPIDKCATVTATSSIRHPLPIVFGLGVDGRPNTPDEAFFLDALRRLLVLGNVFIESSGYPGWLRMLPHNYSATTSIASQLQQLKERYNVVTYMGLGVTRKDVQDANQSVVSFQYTAVMPDDNPPLSEWSREKVQVDPVLADHVHALAGFIDNSKRLLSDQGKPPPEIYLVADTEERRDLAVRSLNSFQLNPVATVGSVSALDAQLAKGRIMSLITPAILAQKLDRTWLFVVAQNRTAVGAAVDVGSDPGFLGLTVLIATSEESIHPFLNTTGVAAADRQAQRLFFATGFKPFWHPNHALFNYITSAFPGTTYIDPRLLSCFKWAAILVEGSELMATRPSGENFVEMFYTTAVAIADISISTMIGQTCVGADVSTLTAERNCQCSKGTTRFYVFSLFEWAHRLPTATKDSFQLTISPCGVVYKTFAAGANLTSTVAGSAAAFVALLLLSIAGIVYAYNRPARDNSLAPKDPNAPFTIVFTDIQSSTSLWARAPQEMSKAVEDHHSEIRKLIKKHKGYEVKTIGDSFMVAFNKPINALKFSIGIQRELFELDWETTALDDTYRDLEIEKLEEKEPDNDASMKIPTYNASVWNGLRVRVGIHFGVGNPQLDPTTQSWDFYGTVVNTAARVEGVGNGGQVLITGAMYQELTAQGCQWDAGTLDVADLGPQPLRGLSEPVKLYQVVPKELSSRTFGPLRLDVEIVVENEEAEQGEDGYGEDVASSAGSSLQSRGVDIDANEEMGKFGVTRKCEALFDKYAKTNKTVDYAVAMTNAIDYHGFVSAMYSTMSFDDKLEALQAVAKKWQVSMPRHLKPKKGKSEKDKSYNDQLFRFLLTKIIVRVAPTHEKSREGFVRKLSSSARGMSHFTAHHSEHPGSPQHRQLTSDFGDRQVSQYSNDQEQVNALHNPNANGASEGSSPLNVSK